VFALSEGGRHRLYQLVAKTDPTLENPAVQSHLRRRLLGTLLGDLERDHIRWL
jgi:hypothetical protein